MSEQKRIINLNGGTYNARIEGNFIQGEVKSTNTDSKRTERNVTNESEVTDGKNFVENLGGKKVNCWF